MSLLEISLNDTNGKPKILGEKILSPNSCFLIGVSLHKVNIRKVKVKLERPPQTSVALRAAYDVGGLVVFKVHEVCFCPFAMRTT
jgi:hypothetical protein